MLRALATQLPRVLGWRQPKDQASFAEEGYFRLPGGLIIQWGKETGIGGNAQRAVVFPIEFPTAFHHGQVEAGLGSASGDKCACFANPTTTGMTLFNNGGGGGTTMWWVAFGT